ncbi:hypothetical protein H0H87_000173 [Tephrocybe sp. NHM501043]|nr:hypothetical protein H0H87_000173 [Tephrocybe sp. NHM501043]
MANIMTILVVERIRGDRPSSNLVLNRFALVVWMPARYQAQKETTMNALTPTLNFSPVAVVHPWAMAETVQPSLVHGMLAAIRGVALGAHMDLDLDLSYFSAGTLLLHITLLGHELWDSSVMTYYTRFVSLLLSFTL